MVTSAELELHVGRLLLVQEPAVQPDDEQKLHHGDDKEDNHQNWADAPRVSRAVLRPMAAMATAGGHPVVVLHRAEEPSSQGVRVGVGPNGGVHLWCLMRVVGLDVDGEMSIVVGGVAAGVVSVCHGCFSRTNGTTRCARGH